LDTNTPISL